MTALEAPSKYKLNMENFVIYVQIKDQFRKEKLPVELIVHDWCGRSDMKVFPSVIAHCRELHVTISIFDNGKVVISGAATEAHALAMAHMAVSRLAWSLNDTSLHVRNFQITNIVSVAYLGFEINLHMFVEDMGDEVIWVPERFAGATWNIAHGITFIALESGKVLSLGQSSVEHVKHAERYLDKFDKYKLYEEHRVLTDEERAKQVRKRKPGQVVEKGRSVEDLEELHQLVQHLEAKQQLFDPRDLVPCPERATSLFEALL